MTPEEASAHVNRPVLLLKNGKVERTFNGHWILKRVTKDGKAVLAKKNKIGVEEGQDVDLGEVRPVWN